MKVVSALLILRVMTILIVITTNFLIIKFLPLSEIGLYYVLGTIAYFGNALFFVGFDIAIQRKIRNISNTKSLNYASLWSYHIKTLPFGCLSVFAMSTILSFMGNTQNWFGVALLCAAMSAINFMLSLSRNILQIADEKYSISFSLFLEQIAKLGVSSGLLLYWGGSAIVVLIAFSLAGIGCLIFNYIQIIRYLKPSKENANYEINENDIKKIVLPVSVSGVTNWLQLQGYRPVLGQIFQQSELVGSVSFLTTLGASVTAAMLGVLAQIWTPKQFASNGDSTRQYAELAGSSVIVLTMLAYPAAYVFLRLLGKEELYGLEYLVCLGVIIEGGNFILGLLGNHSSLRQGSFMPSLFAGIVGLLSLVIIIFILNALQGMSSSTIGISLAISQCVSVVILVMILLHPSRALHSLKRRLKNLISKLN